MPHNLVVKIRGASSSSAAAAAAAAQEEEGGNEAGAAAALVDTEDAVFITLRSDADLARAFAEAEAAGQMVQVRALTPTASM